MIAATKYIIPVLTLLIVTRSIFSLTCEEILVMPAEKKLTVQDLESTPPKEIVKCVAQLGREQLRSEEAAVIWKSIAQYFGGVAEIPDSVLMLLHWITAAIAPEDYANMTLSNIDVIQNFGLNYNLNDAQLSAIANRVREDFAGKEPEDYTYYDLTALRQILCAYNRSEIERIHPAVYREAALLVSKLERCSPEVLAGFAALAVKEEAFGSPSTWSEATSEIVGKSVAQNVKNIGPEQPATPPPTPRVTEDLKEKNNN
ncbi:uncharacterized protein [Choristoneura fumiferana]|uniref:uncharacterized protein n=1 Tax=Choristoneura fumiferana TaxID=7141 RepID=UPI003D15B5F5